MGLGAANIAQRLADLRTLWDRASQPTRENSSSRASLSGRRAGGDEDYILPSQMPIVEGNALRPPLWLDTARPHPTRNV